MLRAGTRSGSVRVRKAAGRGGTVPSRMHLSSTGPACMASCLDLRSLPSRPWRSPADFKPLVCMTFLPLLWLPCCLWLHLGALYPSPYPFMSASLRLWAQSVKINLTAKLAFSGKARKLPGTRESDCGRFPKAALRSEPLPQGSPVSRLGPGNHCSAPPPAAARASEPGHRPPLCLEEGCPSFWSEAGLR